MVFGIALNKYRKAEVLMRNFCQGAVGNFILIPLLFFFFHPLEISCIYFAWQDCVVEVMCIFFARTLLERWRRIMEPTGQIKHVGL